MRLRPRIAFWLFSGSFQKSGSLICCSNFESWRCLAGASKIAPHGEGLLAERNVLSFQFVECHITEEPSLYTGEAQWRRLRFDTGGDVNLGEPLPMVAARPSFAGYYGTFQEPAHTHAESSFPLSPDFRKTFRRPRNADVKWKSADKRNIRPLSSIT
jgi:hypothetical protein